MKPFNELKISTSTVMVYTNLKFNMKNLFCTAPITYIDPPLTKKKKNIDKKKLKAPYGAIISMLYYPPKEDKSGIYFRGIRMSKKKSYWCPMCQLYNKKGNQVLTVHEGVCDVSQENIGTYVTELELETYPEDTKKILFQCSECQRYLTLHQLCKIVPFLNQVTIVMSIGDIIINTMMFDINLKVAGNKSFNDAAETVRLLWEEYVCPNKNNWEVLESRGPRNTDVHFLFESVMINVEFALGFPIDKEKLNTLMQGEEYKDRVFLSTYESTSSTHVNIKMYSPKPDDFYYYVLVYEQKNSKGYTPQKKLESRKNTNIDNLARNVQKVTDLYKLPYFAYADDKWYSRKKPKVEKYITLIVFSSSQTILTGRYANVMEDTYDFFVALANEHKSEIMEMVCRPTLSIREYLEREYLEIENGDIKR